MMVNKLNDSASISIQKTYLTGYDLTMYICGTKRSHVDNVYYLKKQFGCTANEMYDVIESLSPQQRTRYGTGYSKTDLSNILLYTNLDCVHNIVLIVLIVVPINIPANPKYFTSTIDVPKFIIDSISGTYLSSVKIPAFDLNILTTPLSPVK